MVDSTENYVYKIYPSTIKPNIAVPDTGYVFVAGIDMNRRPFYNDLEASGRDGTIGLSWSPDYKEFIGYFIDRSEDNINFKRLNKAIYIPSTDSIRATLRYTYNDSVINYKDYYYKVTGVTAFGERITFNKLAKANGIDLTAPEPPYLVMNEIGSQVKLTWNKPTDPDLLGYNIVRGKDINTVDTIVTGTSTLGPNTLEYNFDKGRQPFSSFYRVLVMDKRYNSSFSNAVYVFTPDTIPPTPPKIIAGTIDSTGLVTIRWKHLKNEPDLQGYKVLFANSKEHNFASESNIVPDTVYSFPTTLRTLTPDLFVKVIAIDANYNHGKPSEAFQLVRPDTIPPRAPVILSYENTVAGILINWSPSVDLTPDKFIVYRKAVGQDNWEQIHETKELSHLDKTVVPRQMYEYSLVEMDLSGNRSSMSFPQTVTASAAPDENITLKKQYLQQSETVQLSWTKPVRQLQAVIIYKDLGQGLTMYERITTDQFEFSEKGKPDTQYAIRIIYSDNSESPVIKAL